MLSPLLFLFFFLLFLHPGIAYPPKFDLTFPVCDDTSYFSSNSTFSTNLAQALETIRNTTAETGFATAYAGEEYSDTVTAQGLCRGTLTPSDCHICIDKAVSNIQSECPYSTRAHLWSFLCMVRYSGENFIEKPNYVIFVHYADADDAPNPDYYALGVNYLMKNLSSTTFSTDQKYGMYGIGRMLYGHNQTLYGYVECIRDLQYYDCSLCLVSAREEIESCCLGKRFGWITTPSCSIKFTSEPVFDDWVNSPMLVSSSFEAPPASIVPPPTQATSSVGGGWLRGLVISVPIGVVVTVILEVGIICLVVQRRRRKRRERKDVEEMVRREGIGLRPFIYEFDVLDAATCNFSQSNQLGMGGFGTVYKGKMLHGEEIAVKVLAAGSVQGIEEFFVEVKVLLDMQHKNLVQLLGCCVQGEKRILVYEYLRNKSLDHTLFNKSKSALLDWPKRYNIIVGVARGLLYLHEDSLLKIIHRDIKASNILLDEHMNPKIADFGLAKLFTDDKSHLITNKIAGTFGYIAPEYANEGFLSTKSDVFSFGVLILEIFSGRKNYNRQLDKEQQVLLNLALRLEQEGRLMELVDVTIGSFPQDKVLRCIQIGLLCCRERIEDRPTMSSTLGMLSNDSVSIPSMGRPTYHGSNRVLEVEALSNGAPS